MSLKDLFIGLLFKVRKLCSLSKFDFYNDGSLNFSTKIFFKYNFGSPNVYTSFFKEFSFCLRTYEKDFSLYNSLKHSIYNSFNHVVFKNRAFFVNKNENVKRWSPNRILVLKKHRRVYQ